MKINIEKALKIKRDYEDKMVAYRRCVKASETATRDGARQLYQEEIDSLSEAGQKAKLQLLEELDRIGLQAAIAEAEGRASVRKITADDILADVIDIIDGLDIPKKYMKGCKARLDPNAQDFPNAYKYIPESTQVTVEWKPSGCVITDIRRDICRASGRMRLSLTEDAKEKVLERVSRGQW